MRLFEALITDHPRVRRSAWPEGVHVSSDTTHKIGAGPVIITDADQHTHKPVEGVRGVRRNLTLRMSDPEGREYPYQTLSPGIWREAQALFVFVIPSWQPSIEDLFADDWEAA